MSNKILNLDLSKDPIMPAIVYGRVADDRLQTVTVNVTRRDEVADLTGYDITFEGTTYNGQTKVFDTDNVSSTAAGLKKGTFDYTFPNMAFAVAGKYEQAYFSIVKDGKRDSTAGFEIYVDGNADIDAPEAETIITEYNKLVDELQKLQEENIAQLKQEQEEYVLEMVQTFSDIKTDITTLEGKIARYETNASNVEKKVSEALTDALGTIGNALEEFQKGNFYTKLEADARYMRKNATNVGADDWNNYTEIGTYGITTGTGANAPVDSTGTLLVQGYGTGGSGRTQVFINSNSIRYRQYQGGGNWTTWQTLSNLGNTDGKYMNIVSTPVKTQDWNTLGTMGTYSVDGATGLNKPSENDTWGTLLVQGKVHNDSMLTQLFISSTNIYFRRKATATSWGSWRTPTPAVATSAEINIGTDNAKMVTAKGLADSKYSKYVKVGEWIPLTFNSGYKSGDGTTLRYRITEYPQADGAVKKYIEFDGAWTTSNDSIPSGGATQQQWAVLPEAIRPAKTKMFPAQCSGFSSTGRVAFVANGICYGAQNTGAAVTYMYVTGMGYWIGE